MIYDYKCSSCEEVSEHYVSGQEEIGKKSKKVADCPGCGARGKMIRIISGTVQIQMGTQREFVYEKDVKVRRQEQIMAMPTQDRRE